MEIVQEIEEMEILQDIQGRGESTAAERERSVQQRERALQHKERVQQQREERALKMVMTQSKTNL